MKKEEKTFITKQKILNAATKAFGKHGYLGASMSDICSEGIAKGLIYHNFANKDELYLKCVEKTFFELTEFIKQQNTSNDMEKYMGARREFFQTHENEAHIFFETVFQPPSGLKTQIAQLRKPFDTLNTELYEELLNNQILHNGVTKADAMGYFSFVQTMFNGYCASSDFGEVSFSKRMELHEENLARWLDFMLYGIAKGKTEL